MFLLASLTPQKTTNVEILRGISGIIIGDFKKEKEIKESDPPSLDLVNPFALGTHSVSRLPSQLHLRSP